MPTTPSPPDPIHFRSLQLENVRAFGSRQSLEFVDDNGAVSHWNLILGENGVGKTTLMQALAGMRPIPGVKEDSEAEESPQAGPPTLSTAELSVHENDDLMRFIRTGGPRTATMVAVLEADGATLKTRVEIKGTTNELESAEFGTAPHQLLSDGPLVIGYGAGRHVGHRNLAVVSKRDATGSLFWDAIDLYDAEEIMEKLDHAAKSDPDAENGRDPRLLTMLKTAVASLLPDVAAAQIEIRGPRVEGRDPGRSGVHVRTPSGVMPLADLSLGYQGMFAWTVDLAWRLFNAFPNSAEPLSESAIVLIDEVDLHLHPSWQRNLRRHLLAQFPKVQFIATTHSPVTAQATLSEGGNVSFVGWEDGEARIHNRPIPKGEWRYDQLLVSEIFGVGSSRSRAAEAKLSERIELIRNPHRSADQEARLRELDEFVASLPTASSPSAQHLEDLMRDLRDFPKGVVR